METSYIITFIGDDRPGLVEQVSSTIVASGGNWHESRLTQLGGKFAGLALVSLPTDSGGELEENLKSLSSSGLSVRVTPTVDVPGDVGGRSIQLSIVGPDRLGIVSEISRALAGYQINVVEMDSAVSSAPMSAEMLFEASITAQVPQHTDMHELQESLEAIANQMTLDIHLED